MKKWWLFIILGCLLLASTYSLLLGVIAFLCALFIYWFLQKMIRIDFLLCRIQEGVKKLEKGVQKLKGISQKWSSKN